MVNKHKHKICLPSPSRSNSNYSGSESNNDNNKKNSKSHKKQMAKPNGRREEQHPSTPSTVNSHSHNDDHNNSSSSGRRYRVDSGDQGTSTKSCLNIFSSGGGSASHHRQRLKSRCYENSSSDSDSSDSDMSEWQAFSSSSPSLFSKNTHTNTTNTTSSKNGAYTLLQPPKPTDRSHKRRALLEQKQRAAGVYEGELEPEGIRGQEASVAARPFPITDHVYSSLHNNNSTSTTTNNANSFRWMRPLETIAEAASESRSRATEDSSSLDDSRYYNNNNIEGPTPTPPNHNSNNKPPTRNLSFESSSTNSDEDIHRMMSDFLLQNNNHTHGIGQSLVDRDYPNPIHTPMDRNNTSHSSTGSRSANMSMDGYSLDSGNGNGIGIGDATPSHLLHKSQSKDVNNKSGRAFRQKQQLYYPKEDTTPTTARSTPSPHSHISSQRSQSPSPQHSQSPSPQPSLDLYQQIDFLKARIEQGRQQQEEKQQQRMMSSSQQPQQPQDQQWQWQTEPPARQLQAQTQLQQQWQTEPTKAQTQQQPSASKVIPVTVSHSSSSSEPSASPDRYSPDRKQATTILDPRTPSTTATATRNNTNTSRNHPPPQYTPRTRQVTPTSANISHQPPSPISETGINTSFNNNNNAKPHPDPPTTNNNNNTPLRQEEETHDQNDVDTWNALALQHVQKGEYDMALAAFQHVLRSYQQQYGSVHPLVASAYHNLGTVHAKRAQLLLDDTVHQRHCRAQSLQCFQAAARAARDSLGRDHPNVAVSLVRIGFLLLQARQYNNAVVTFQEALRIRQAHYGPHHGLVANLYNNLGVCYMHLGQFAHGRDLLQHALTIQRQLVEAESNVTGEEKKDGHSSTVNASQALELADTLFNIGGLALEWIRRQGPDVRHAEDAEVAFEEALELRKSVLGPKDPMVLQVKSLLDMARSIPRPKSPARSRGPHSPSRGNGNVNYHAHPPQQPDSSPSHGMAPSQRDTPPRKAANEGSFSPSRRPETMARKETSPIAAYLRPPSAQSNLSNQTGNQPSSPYRYYPSSNGLTPPRPSGRTSAGSPHKADYLEPPKVSRRGAASLSNRDDGDQPAAIAARNSNARSSPASVTTVKAGEMSMDAQSSNSQPRSQLQQGVFRQSQRPSKEDKSNLPPPVQEVTVSNDEDDDGLYDPRALSKPNQTNIFISPHYVPHMSPHKVNMSSSTGETPSSRTTSTFSGLPVSPDSKLEIGNTSAIQKQYSYDVEESCMITDRLGNGGEGQLPDDYSASMPSKETADTNRKIMVMRPYRSSPGDHSITSPTSFASGRKHMIDDDDDDSINRKGATADTRDSLYGSDMEYSSKTSSWSSQAHRNEREVTLSRARALLQANQDNLDSPQVQLAGKPPFLHSPDRVKQQLFQNKGGGDDKDESLGQDLEDGLAPLGSSDSPSESSPQKRSFGFHRKMLTDQPETHLREIYDEASRCMKNHHYAEAIECFQAILQCHRQKHGPYHQDVASALHNCGLAHLRANNNHEAVKCFEEAVRIRKGVLGKEHPHVAASLVKCGITFLLLHRYEEALWSFREALSVRKHALGNLHPSTARIYNNIGCVHVEFNELREARRAFEAALDIQRNALCNDPESGPVRFGAATTLCNLGYLYRYRGMHEKAALVLKEASDIQEAILGQTHPTVLSTLDSLAEALVNSGQSLHALRTHETILERIRSMEQPGSPRLIKAEAVLQYKMSKACKQLNDKESQIRHLQQALQATRSQEVQTDAAQIQAAALEKKILQDLRDVRESMEASQLKWV